MGQHNISLTATIDEECSNTFNDSIEVFDISCGKNGQYVTVCHLPEGYPGESYTTCVPLDSLAVHLNHGDCVERCKGYPGDRKMNVDNALSNGHRSIINLDVYPNPSKESMKIVFMLDTTTKVKLEIYNYWGQQIDVVYDGVMDANITHEIRIADNDLAKGLYYAVLRTANEKIVKAFLKQ